MARAQAPARSPFAEKAREVSMMKLEKTPIALAALALFAAAPLTVFAAPTVSFKTPLAGATISGSISQTSACEATGTNIRRIVFSVSSPSGATTALNTEYTAPWNCNIDTRKFADGSYTLKAVAYDGANVSASATRSVTIKNGTTANLAPTVSVNPLGTVSGSSVACGAAASDSNGVKQVQFFLDGSSTAFATDTTAPYA